MVQSIEISSELRAPEIRIAFLAPAGSHNLLLAGSNGLGFRVPNRIEERVRRCRHSNFAMKDGSGRVITAIDGFGGVIVAANCRPSQRDSGKQAFGS